MTNPMRLLADAVENAKRARDPGADSLNLVTIDAGGAPTTRMLTIRALTDSEVVVTGNCRSPKFEHLQENGVYEAHLFWPLVLGQARLRGGFRIEDPPELAAGWQQRAYGGKLNDLYQVHCRPQSSVVSSRESMLRELDELRERFPVDRPIAKPAEIVNLVLVPEFVELWIGDAADRMHDRRRYTLTGDDWREEILVP
jgi:pyridoxamine 5'-phosphate oxidase